MAAFPVKLEGSQTNSMHRKIVIIETLIFVLPLLAILYIIYRGNYYFDLLQVIMFMVIAFFVLVGMIIIRQILTRISIVATSLKKAESGDVIPIDVQKEVVEFREMSVSLNGILQKLEQVTAALTQKSLELSVIKNLTDIIKGNLSIDDQLNILLEKCMAVTGAQIGSVLIVEPEMRQQYIAAKSTPISASDLYRFRVCAAVGHGEKLKKGTLISIEKSVVKAALLEKEPLLIHDISKDPRTSKTNDPKYGPPSFLSMPIIIGDTVSAILNLAYKRKGQLFDDNDEQVISIILRDIGFALENTMLQSRINEQLEKIRQHHINLEREIEKRTRTEMMLKYNNVAELKRAEETLAESEEKYRFITEKMTDIVWIQDMNLRTVYVSPSIEAALGFSPEERVSQDVHEQLTPESMSVALDVMAKELALEQQGQADPERKIVIELEYYHKDGSTRWAENIITGIRDDQGVLTGLHGVSRDITKRKRAEEALCRAEENFRRSLDESPMGVRIVTLEGKTLYANRAILDFYGYDSIEELVAVPIENRYTPQSYAEFQARLEKRKKGDHEPSEYEISIVRKNGEIRHLLAFRKEVIWDGERQFQLLYHDITERKRAEDALKDSEEKYRLLVENADEAILVAQDGMLKYVNPMTMRILGSSETELLSKPFIEIVYPDDREKMMAAHLKRMRGDQTETVRQFRVCCKDGSVKWADSHAVVISWNGKPATLNFLMDITIRKQAEEALRESEIKYRELFDFLPISMFEVGLLGNVTSANPAIFETFGYTQPDFEKGLNGFKMIIPDDQQRLAENIQKLLNRGWKGPSEYTGIRKDGSTFPILIFPNIIMSEGKPAGLRGAIIDLTDRKRMEESLKKSNLSLAEAQRISHIGNWEWDVSSNDMYWSDEIYRIAGLHPGTCYEAYESLIEWVHPDDREAVKRGIEKAVHGRAKGEIEHRILRYDGALREVRQLVEPIMDNAGKIVRVIGIMQDITERVQAEEELQKARDQLLQSEKLASLGRLSAGVAHEILNPVNIISMELQMLQAMEGLPPEVQEELNICMAQTKRIVNITQNLKQLSRIPIKKTVMADMNDIIAHILSLHASQLKIDGIETEVQYQPDLPAIAMDKEKIEHVILNLISNAMDAMEGKEKKVLRIRTEMDKMLGDCEQLKITIADTGTGIHSEHMSKIFDPFFTTKEPGKGTGLGLSISYSIVHDHKGMIWAVNNEWGGASFYVRLPIKTDV